MATSYGPPVDYAGFWARVAAYVVDVAILVILTLAIAIGSAFAGDIGVLIGTIVNFIINLLYWPVMESSARQATFGKSIVGIQVTDLNGNRVTFLRSLLRNLAKIISAIPLGIGYLLAAFTGRKQALHDMITKCLVVRTGPSHFVKAFAAAAGALVIAVGSGGAYFYYVIMPKAQEESGETMLEAKRSPVNPVPVKPLVVAPKPPVAATPQPAPAIPEPAPAVPPKAVVAVVAPESAREPAPEPVKPASKPRKYASKIPKPVTMAEPMDSKTVAPAESREDLTKSGNPPSSKQGVESTPPRASALVSEPASAVAFAPDTESRVIRPKYNDVMTAVLRGDRDAVKQLLDLGWWVDKPGADGLTPLMAAVMNRDTQMVQLLLDHGAVPSSQALKLARDKKDTETASLLEQRGAR